MKNNVKSVVVLTLICVVVTALLGVTNYYTAPVIAANKEKAANASLTEVMQEGQGFEEMELPADAPATVTRMYRETSGQGYVVLLTTTSQYSSDDMGITVGIGSDGVIRGIALTSYYESKDFGADYPQTYVGADSALNGIDTVAGVTYSSTAFKNAVSDAFSTLLSSGAVSEGTKDEATTVAELIPAILPGAASAAGAQITEVDAAGFKKAYAADNGSGYVVAVDASGSTILAAVNAFGDVKFYDLEGNETEGPTDEVKAAFPSLAAQNLEANDMNASKALGADGVQLRPVDSLDAYGLVTGAFTADVDGQTYYIFNVKPYGYSNEVMEMAVVLDSEGKIVNYRTVSDLILHEEYYTSHELADKETYKNSFDGLDETTFYDDMTEISGATMTADAVAASIHSAFDAFKALTAAQN